MYDRCIVGTHSVELQSLQDKSYWIVMVNEKQWNPCFPGFPLRSANVGDCRGHAKLKAYYRISSLSRALPEGRDERARNTEPKLGHWEGCQPAHQVGSEAEAGA